MKHAAARARRYDRCVARRTVQHRMPGAYRRWVTASLRELFRPLVLGYVLLAVGVDAARAYSYWPNLDVPMHYLGALTLTYLIERCLGQAIHYQVLPPLRRIPRALAVFSLACTVSLVWELAEFASDRYLATAAQGGLADTMRDLMLDIFGIVSLLVVTALLSVARARHIRREADARKAVRSV